MKHKNKKGGRWVFVADSPENAERIAQDEVIGMLTVGIECRPEGEDRFIAACRAVEEFHDYFPGSNELPKDGAWILVKQPPHTEYTVSPLSIWFAESWPFNRSGDRRMPHRVRIVTPRGDLGLYPREYSLITDITKYFEFIGEGMEIRFFGNTKGVPEAPLFYLRSRGLSKQEAIKLLLGQIKAHGVCWIESHKEICAHFGFEWPENSRLANAA